MGPHLNNNNYFNFPEKPSVTMTTENSKVQEAHEKWAKALTKWVDKQGGDGPSLWQWSGICPTPERVTEYLDFLLDLRCDLAAKGAADREFEGCCKAIRDGMWFADPTFRLEELRRERRPNLREQALKDWELLKSSHNIDPEVAKRLEEALSHIPSSLKN